ncbi:MAG: mannonate dehydratase [Phycisphaeraceae bacterium]
MHLGFGLYSHQLDEAHFAFARQCGATHLVVHLVDYFAGRDAQQRRDQPVGDLDGWGRASGRETLWTAAQLKALQQRVKDAGLTLFALENLNPGHWYDILLDGPQRDRQVADVQRMLEAMGEAGIAALGYYFSLAGVAGRTTGPFARGGAQSVGMDGPFDTPLPRRMVWNMVVDEAAGDQPHAPVTRPQLWDRLRRFLEAVVPVAERAGVKLAAHPDDPPLPEIRGTPRLIYQPRLYQELIDLCDSPHNGLELCVGTLAEMTEPDLYAWIDRYAQQDRIVYVHLRNVRDKVPYYRETFIDEGDVDVPRVLRILHERGFEGVVIPDHAPRMSCDAPWHAGMAFAMGYLCATMQDLARTEAQAVAKEPQP